MGKQIAYTKREIHIKSDDVDRSRLNDLSDHDINILLLQGSTIARNVYQERPDGGQYAECLEMLDEGDTLRVAYLDDIAESVKDLMSEINKLRARGIIFQCTANRFDNDPDLKYRRWGTLWMI